jgi:hypothetical protein
MSSTFAPRDEMHQTFIWSITHTVLAEEQFHFSDNNDSNATGCFSECSEQACFPWNLAAGTLLK